MRVLSLDGGGSWALLQVQALMDLFPQARTGHDVLRQFDYAAANSGGTIVLAGLIEDLPLTRVQDFFLEERARREVFSLLPWWQRLLPRYLGIGPRYDEKSKLAGLAGRMPVTGPQLITELGRHVGRSTGRNFDFLIATFDYDRCRAVLQRSDAGSPTASGAAPHVPTLLQAVHATTSAPVNYFNRPAIFDLYDRNLPVPGPRRRRFWDGAIGGYNNPALAAVVEILAGSNPPEVGDISMLSIGTGTVNLPFARYYPDAPALLVREERKESLLQDIKTVATAIMDDPPDAASFIAHVWLGGALPARTAPPVTNGPLVRMNPLVQPVRTVNGTLALPGGVSADDFDKLRKLEMDAIEQDEVLLIQRFGWRWLADDVTNQAIRATSFTLEPQIGFNRYSEAKAAWLTRAPFR